MICTNEKNYYTYTMQPVLFLMRITGIIPLSLEIKDTRAFDIESKIIPMFGLAVFISNFIYSANQVIRDYFFCFEHNFEGEIVLALIPSFLLRSMIFLIPFTLWTKSQQLRKYWIQWAYFQNEYRNILNLELFASKFQKKLKWTAGQSIACIIITQVMMHMHISYGGDYVRLTSDALNMSLIYFIVTYWVSNCIYVRLIGIEMNEMTKECVKDGKCSRKLKQFAVLWLSLQDLVDEFVRVHSSLFLFYFIEVIIGVICMAYINFVGISAYSRLFDARMAIHFFTIIFGMIFIICEAAHRVHMQVSFKQKEMLLEQNTRCMNQAMLQSMSRFLDIILIRNPSININGIMSINRSFFPHTIAVVINNMIILRQFQS